MAKRAKKAVKRNSKKVAKKGLLSGMDELPELLKPEEAQNVLRVSRATMFRMIERAPFPALSVCTAPGASCATSCATI